MPLTNGCSSQISGAEAKQKFQFNNYNLFEREIVLVDHMKFNDKYIYWGKNRLECNTIK